MATEGRAVVLGCPIDRVDMQQALRRCDEIVRAGGFGQHMAVNAAKLVSMQSDSEMRAITERCALVTADGQGVVWAARALGERLPGRVAGIDLMEELFALAAACGYSVYVLGARAEVLERAIGELRHRHPGLRVAGYRDGYFDPAEDAAVAEQIRRTAPDLLFVAMSSPRKERFLGVHGAATGAAFAMGVGGAIDVVAGQTRRAPRWMQRLGLEWLYRLAQEPRRLVRRYTTTNTRFALLVARAWIRRFRLS